MTGAQRWFIGFNERSCLFGARLLKNRIVVAGTLINRVRCEGDAKEEGTLRGM